ncbi:MAG TPA: DUF262 domain-containing protein [Pyrinomonadaceae bacterium]|nr:DUF262 domain-containing protein [Pyrinomonadaceae bacterium]
MNYRNRELKLDQLINYLNEGKINLSPAFQRGQVWPIGIRRKLMANIVEGRPIPAIFLYKEPDEERYSYNILDGKQRIESLILFVGPGIKNLGIANWADYFFAPHLRRNVSFSVPLPSGKHTFKQLDPTTIRDFREYAIPTVEITLEEDEDGATNLDEIIQLFVDINQQGVAVSRFQIVKAMGLANALLKSSFDLIALKQVRGEAVFYKSKSSVFTRVLRRLSLVANTVDNNAAVDRMWERLLEIALFLRTKQHQKPVEVLKRFINTRKSETALTTKEVAALRSVFSFLAKAYNPRLGKTRLATDNTHFYTMITSLIAGDLMEDYSEPVLTKKLLAFARIIDGGTLPKPPRLKKLLEDYIDVSSKQTTDVSRRDSRQALFIEAVREL